MSDLPERASAPARPLWRPALLAVLLLALAWLIWTAGLHGLSLESLAARQQALLQWHEQQPWQARLALAGLYVAVTALSLPGAALLSLACGAVLGMAWGTVVALLSATLGATLAMLTARYLLGPWVQRIGGARLAAVDQGMARDGVRYLLSMRLLPVLPFFLINLAVGLTQMPARTFAWVSLLGMAPGALVYVHAGGALAQIRSPADIMSAQVLGALALLAALPWLMRWALPHWQRRRTLAPWRAQRPRRFDRNLVVIGGGAGGLVAAYMAAALRARVSLIEADRLGGDCLYRGCVPSKALIHVSRQLHQIGQSAHLGLRVAAVSVDWPVLMQRVREVIAQIEPHDSIERYSALGVDVISGHARIVNPWTVEINASGSSRRLSTRAIVIATGARPVVPQWPGLADVDPVTSDTLWDRLAACTQIPDRVAVIGGGAIGCELAQALARLGARVTLIERGPRLLAREDEDVSAVALTALQGAGVQVLLQAQPLAFGRDPQCHARLQTPAGEQRLPFDLLLLALGRKPHLQGFGLEELGLHDLQLDAYLETAIAGIYAVGDVTEQWQLTHAAAHQGWHAAVHALQGLRRFRVDRAPMPQTLFLDPEIARVGLNEQQARALAHEVTRFDLAELDRAIIEGQREGFVKLITAAGSGRLLGATVVGPHAGQLLAEYTLAIQQGLSLKQLLSVVRAYPTWSEANKYAAGAYVRARQPAWALRWLERYHAWRRG